LWNTKKKLRSENIANPTEVALFLIGKKSKLKGKDVIRARLERVRAGNTGKLNSVGQGVQELKFKPKGLPATGFILEGMEQHS